jgi:hypothetical protein
VRIWGLLAAVLALSGSASAPPRVTLLADSVGGVLYWDAGARERLGHRLDLRVDQESCRKLVEPGCPAFGIDAPESALAAVQRLGAELGQIVVVNVGYNEAAEGYAGRLDQVMAALVAAGVQHVIWVTLSERQDAWAEINDQIRAAPARWPQLVVADWARVKSHDDWFVDEAHFTYLGAGAYASFLRTFVLAACGAHCAPTLTFCGLARTVNGFDPVSAGEVACGNVDVLPRRQRRLRARVQERRGRDSRPRALARARRSASRRRAARELAVPPPRAATRRASGR